MKRCLAFSPREFNPNMFLWNSLLILLIALDLIKKIYNGKLTDVNILKIQFIVCRVEENRNIILNMLTNLLLRGPAGKWCADAVMARNK